jgi:hypothetical protein
LYETYITEAERNKGTLKLGKGPVFEKNTKHNLASAQLDTIRKTTWQNYERKNGSSATDLDKKNTETRSL